MRVKRMCFDNIINYFKDRNQCFIDLEDYKKNNQALMIEYEDLEKKYDELYDDWEALNDSLKPDPLETYWNDKRTKTDDYIRKVRTVLNKTVMTYVDPRIFFNATDNIVPVVTGTNDEKAYAALNKVIDLITYTSDTSQFKQDEEWLFPYESLQLEHGDCEDGAILLANIMLKSGIPYWRIRLNAGDVKGGGHCWVTYLRESDNQWVILDWCYWPEQSLPGLLYHDAENYFDIWFSWNTKHIYLDENFERDDL
jgi:predicted transglutaminase-like cysteine proteinase